MSENKTYREKIFPLAIFLTVELLFLIGFNFGNFSTLLRVIAVLLALVLAPVLFKELQLSLSKGLFFVVAPLFLYSFVTVFAPAYQSGSGITDIDYILMSRSIFSLLFNALGIIALVVLGYFVSKTDFINPLYIFATIFGGLALLLIVSLFATMINYGPFYRYIYADRVNFYYGETYNIADQSSFLLGFKIITADYRLLSNLALFLSAAGGGFLFVSDFKDKKLVSLLSVATLLGVLTLILLPDFRALIYLIPALFIGALIKFKVTKMKHFKIGLYVVGSIVALTAGIMLLAAFNSFNIVGLLDKTRVARKLFLNGRLQKFYAVLRESFNTDYLFGLHYTRNLTTGDLVFPTGNIIFDSLRIDGLFAAIFLLLFFVFSAKSLYNYWQKGAHHLALKFMILSSVITIFIRFMLHYPFYGYIHHEQFWSVDYFPLIESQYFALFAFIVGFTHIDSEKAYVTEEVK